MIRFIMVILFLVNSSFSSEILDIGTLKGKIDLLPHASIYIDKTNNLTINDIKKKERAFISNDKITLGYGYSPDFTVWVKLVLKNDTNKRIDKIIEYDNTLTTNIIFYDGKSSYQDGLLHIDKQRRFINPIFYTTVESNSIRTYYFKLSSNVTALIIKLNLWNTKKFYINEVEHQFILALFFGSMLILAIYNVVIYFVTQDKSYIYYVFYILGTIVHHLVYVGVAFIYFLPSHIIYYFVESASFIVSLPIFALAFFTKHFLNIPQYKIINLVLNTLLILMFISIIIFVFSDFLDNYRNIFPLIVSVYLIYVTIYSAVKKNKQAYFILFGRFVIFFAFIFMYLSSKGLFNIYEYFEYFIEIAFVLEAIIFSIALSNKINTLQVERNKANERLFEQQQNEKERLKIQVSEKTLDLKEALDEKGILLKEINHRVKNNMQTIVSLIRLQNDKIDDEKYKDILNTIQNRINAMSHLHEILYQSDNIKDVNVNEYFVILIDELQYSFEHDIEVKLNISVNLKIKQAIYCGLIFNELLTNSFKYAFPDNNGKVDVKLYKNDNEVKLIVSDNGIGYEQATQSDTLGLLLIESLVKIHFKGTIDIKSEDGVTVEISWNDS